MLSSGTIHSCAGMVQSELQAHSLRQSRSAHAFLEHLSGFSELGLVAEYLNAHKALPPPHRDCVTLGQSQVFVQEVSVVLLCSFQQCIHSIKHPGSVTAVFVRRMQMCAGIKALQCRIFLSHDQISSFIPVFGCVTPTAHWQSTNRWKEFEEHKHSLGCPVCVKVPRTHPKTSSKWAWALTEDTA